jgi:3-oxoacyl-[acyl-carrier protein] reductase
MNQFCSLDGRVALVTGGASGIGRAIVCELAGGGAKVYIHFHKNEEAASELAAELAGRGANVGLLKANLADAEQTKAMYAQIQAADRGLDILVNNAGVMRTGMMSMLLEAQFEEMIDINVSGAYRNMQLASRMMMRRRFGRIINIGSIIGSAGAPGHVAYAATKGSVAAMTLSVAKELGTFGITVNAVAPGIIDTKMIGHIDEAKRREITKAIALGRIGKPQDVAPLVRFLCSDVAGYITGQIIGVDGAYVL